MPAPNDERLYAEDRPYWDTTVRPEKSLGELMEGFAMPRRIPLTQGKFAIVDAADYAWLNQWKWYYHKLGYAVRSVWEEHKKGLLYMHRVILNAPPDMQTDHRNMEGLDNRRCNLRLCTSSQNKMNKRKRAGCSSRYKGVCWFPRDHKWKGYIEVNGRTRNLGYFDDELDAARAYDVAARQHFREFARLNLAEEKRV